MSSQFEKIFRWRRLYVFRNRRINGLKSRGSYREILSSKYHDSISCDNRSRQSRASVCRASCKSSRLSSLSPRARSHEYRLIFNSSGFVIRFPSSSILIKITARGNGTRGSESTESTIEPPETWQTKRSSSKSSLSVPFFPIAVNLLR